MNQFQLALNSVQSISPASSFALWMAAVGDTGKFCSLICTIHAYSSSSILSTMGSLLERVVVVSWTARFSRLNLVNYDVLTRDKGCLVWFIIPTMNFADYTATAKQELYFKWCTSFFFWTYLSVWKLFTFAPFIMIYTYI